MCRTLLFALILNLLFPLYGSAKFIEPYLKENLSEEEKQQELVENIALASTGAFLTILSKQISPKRLVNQYTQAHKQLQFAEAKLRKKIVELRKKIHAVNTLMSLYMDTDGDGMEIKSQIKV
jgi:DNA/RNA-binding domain of Phe-tRNA-synthetase-like protein